MAYLSKKQISRGLMHYGLFGMIILGVVYLSAGVYYVDSSVLTPGSDESYRAQAQANSSLVDFDPGSLSEAQTFEQSTVPAPLPAGRVSPFAP